MYAILKRNLYYFYHKSIYLLLPLFCIFIFFVTSIHNDFIDSEAIFYILTGTYHSSSTFLFISLSLVINMTYLYYAYILFTYDINYNKENIFYPNKCCCFECCTHFYFYGNWNFFHDKYGKESFLFFSYCDTYLFYKDVYYSIVVLVQ